MPFKAIVFDFDGTLVDTEIFHFHCWNEVLAEYGLSVTYEQYLAEFAGVPTPVNASMLVQRHKLSVSEQALLEKREKMARDKMETGEFRMMSQARETLEYFHQRRFPMALSTGSPRADVDILLKKLDLAKFFVVTVTRDDVAHSKPDPESYQKCVDVIGFPKSQILAFEDTPNGAKSAKAAGLTCYAVQHDVNEHPRLSHADRIFHDMKDALDFLQQNHLI